jgi:3'-phosphoadenosine 5'-phosphosulfate sulfotransferase (PAPS reductase)/FAD synthetase
MQSLPLEVKIEKSKQRIKEWYEAFDGQVYVSFSGGKDSTVLLHLVRSMYPDAPAVFVDTGLEYPEIKEFVRTVENVETLRPKLSFREVIEKVGYPVISKKTARKIHDLKHPTKKNAPTRKLILEGIKRDGTESKNFILAKKWYYLVNAPFEISNKCCAIMKHSPFGKFERKSKLKPFVGDMADDGNQRESTYLQSGCNNYRKDRPISQPLGFWLESDVWEYIHKNNISYCKVYDTGIKRTGCMFCMFGCHLEGTPNRFQRMKKTHPQLYHYCMKPWSEGGLGLASVLDFIKVPYGDYYEQMDISDICQSTRIESPNNK